MAFAASSLLRPPPATTRSPLPGLLLHKSSFLPPAPVTTAAAVSIPRHPPPLPSTPTTVWASRKKPSHSSPSVKIVRFAPLDRRAAAHNRLRFARKLSTLLLSKPRRFLPLRVLSRCRHYLSLPPSRPILPFILRYPALFHLFRSPSLSPSSISASLLSVALTPAAEALFADLSLSRARLADALAAKLQRLLMLAPARRILLSNLVHLAPDLGLPANFRSRLCVSRPECFRVVDTSYGRALELAAWDPILAVPTPPLRPPPADTDRLIIDRPPKFRTLPLRRGLNLKRRHRDFLLRLRELPEASPYDDAASPLTEAGKRLTAEEEEKRACAVVREVLAMTVEKRTLVDHLTHLRKDLGLPNRLRGMLVRHPEMFYVSVKGVRHSVFLVEAYDDKGKLLVEGELLKEKERLMELVREGKKMRRERRKRDVGYGHGYNEEEEEEEEGDDGDEELELVDDEDDEFGDFFESGIEDDWEELVDLVDTDAEEEEEEVAEFWVKKAASTSGGIGVSGSNAGSEAW